MERLRFINILILMLVGLLVSDAFAQAPRPAEEKQDDTLVWEKGCKLCLQHFSQGIEYRFILAPEVIIAMTFTDTGARYEADVILQYRGKKTLNVIPSEFIAVVIDPAKKELKQIAPQKIVKSIRNKAKWLNAFTALGGGATTEIKSETTETGSVEVANRNGKVLGRGEYSGKSETTTTVPDLEARARAADKIQQRKLETDAKAAAVESDALLAQTLRPEEKIAGTVYFERDKSAKRVAVAVEFDNKMYIIPFDVSQK